MRAVMCDAAAHRAARRRASSPRVMGCAASARRDDSSHATATADADVDARARRRGGRADDSSVRGAASASVRSDASAAPAPVISGVPVPRHQRGDGASSSSRDASRDEALARRVEDVRVEASRAVERSVAERAAHVRLLADERAVVEKLRRELMDERARAGGETLGERGGDHMGASRRGATHTTRGAVLDRRFVLGLRDTTPNAIDDRQRGAIEGRSLTRQKSGVSTTTTASDAVASRASGADTVGDFVSSTSHTGEDGDGAGAGESESVQGGV